MIHVLQELGMMSKCFDKFSALVLIHALQELGTVLARVGERMTEKELLAMVAEVSTFL